MGRNTVPFHLLKGNYSKKEIAERAEKEQKVAKKFNNDKILAPEWLDESATELFNQIATEFEQTDLLRNVDVISLATYCDLHSRRLELMKEVKEKGHVLTNKNAKGGITYVQNPALTALNTTIKLLQQYESKFGMNIIDRTKISLKEEEPKEVTEEDRLFGDV